MVRAGAEQAVAVSARCQWLALRRREVEPVPTRDTAHATKAIALPTMGTVSARRKVC